MVFLPSLDTVIHKHISSYNLSNDDPLIADLLQRRLRSDRAHGGPITEPSVLWWDGCSPISPPAVLTAITACLLCGFCWGVRLGRAPRAVGFGLFEEPQCLIRQSPWHNLAGEELGVPPSRVRTTPLSSQNAAAAWLKPHLFTALGAGG